MLAIDSTEPYSCNTSTIAVEPMRTHLTKELIDACTGCTNPKTIGRRLRSAGGIGDAVQIEQVLVALGKRDTRRRTRRTDPLVFAQFTRDRRLADFKTMRRIERSKMFSAWRSDFRDRILRNAKIDFDYDTEAQLATIEAICRRARQLGWEVRHTSQSKDGRASSRYVKIPGFGEVRISDHELPQTAERDYRRENGMGPRWVGEIVIGNDWRHVRLEAWIRKIILAAGGRL